MHLARTFAARLPGSLLDHALASAWNKVTADAGQLAMPAPGDDSFSLSAFPTIDYAPFRDRIERLQRAIRDRLAVQLRYRRANGQTSERVIEPGELHADAATEGLYCIAWCRARKAVRVFAVHRVLSAELTSERFSRRPETRSRAALQHAFRLWRGDAVHTVRLRFAAPVAGEIAERRWHPSQVLGHAANGDVSLEFRIAEPASLVRWLLGFGEHVEILEPDWLASEVLDCHRRAGRLRPTATVRRPGSLRRQQGRFSDPGNAADTLRRRPQ
jgi:predicted DNA-binding transcriptional regulator YafY